MSNIGKRLMQTTADLSAAAAEPRRAGADAPLIRPLGVKTAPGQLMAARDQMVAMEQQLTELREKLKHFDGSMPTVKLDPTLVQPSDWANRHERAFTTPEFTRLKTSIEHAGGNSQPILVRRNGEGRFEVVFGHRRHRACLELGLPVLAVIWDGPMNDMDLFLHMDRENRERADLSPWEQGRAYKHAIERGLFRSARQLGDQTGVSHTWVNRTLIVADLPEAIVECFASPLDIKVPHAQAIAKALEADKRAVLRRAEQVRRAGKKLGASAVVDALLATERASEPQRIRTGDRVFGTWKRDPKGRAVITVEAADDAAMERVSEAIVRALAGAGN